MIACVLDLDETLGWFDEQRFLVRPKLEVLIDYLRTSDIDIILWSMGTDDYVTWIVNNFVDSVKQHAWKIFGRTECMRSQAAHQYYKASEHIRNLYRAAMQDEDRWGHQEIFLIGVDDKATTNMDDQYDLRISPRPYKKNDPSDRELMKVIEVIVKARATNEI